MGALDTAYAYAELGWAVLPLCGVRHACKTPGKVPFDFATGRHMADWQSRGVPTPEEIDRWLAHPAAERANIGVICGRVSGIVALDIDGEAGEALLRELAGGEPEPTLEFITGGGRRLIYALPEGARIVSRKLGSGHQGLEVLSDGRQMVVPPSVHPSGRTYAWKPGRDPWTFGPPAPCPPWLLRLSAARAPRPVEEWERLLREGADPGSRHPSLTQIAGHLLAKDVDPRIVLELLASWNEARCRPPKPRDEVESIVRDLWAKERAKRAGAGAGEHVGLQQAMKRYRLPRSLAQELVRNRRVSHAV